MSEDRFLSRWSRLKREARAADPKAQPAPPELEAAPRASAVAPVQDPATSDGAPLPPVESLTTESDFTAFMKPDVDPATRRQALKTLFADPQFNVMDGLDVYIDDYSKPDPLPLGWLEKLNQVARLGDYVPATEGAKEDRVEAAAAAAPEVPSLPETAPEPPIERPIDATERMPVPAARFDTSDDVSPGVPLKESGKSPPP